MRRLVVLGLLALAVAGCGGGGGTTITGVAGAAAPVTTSSVPTATPVQASSKGFVVVSTDLKKDPLGFFGGMAQIRNDNKVTHTASMRFTFTRDTKVVGTADALADDVPAGQTATVQLNSIDKWDGQPVSYSFQVSSLY